MHNDTWLYRYSGKPAEQELIQRQESGNHQLGYRIKCPNCEHGNTEFLRNSYWMCHDCGIWFTVDDAKPVYDVAAYNEDERIPDELLDSHVEWD